MDRLDRRVFLGASALGIAGVAAARPSAPRRAEAFSFSEGPEAAGEIVGPAHRGLDAIRSAVEARPERAKAAVDWGFGDWESALGAASHTGQIEAVEFLLSHGARPDQFTFAVLGRVDVLRAMIQADPTLVSRRGPHDISLLAHARAGGDRAALCAEYLEEIGGADEPLPTAPLEPEHKAILLGRYELQGRDGEFRIEERRDKLFIAPAVGSARGIRHEAGLVFRPAGAPHVALRASVSGTPAILCEAPSGKLWWAQRAGD